MHTDVDLIGPLVAGCSDFGHVSTFVWLKDNHVSKDGSMMDYIPCCEVLVTLQHGRNLGRIQQDRSGMSGMSALRQNIRRIPRVLTPYKHGDGTTVNGTEKPWQIAAFFAHGHTRSVATSWVLVLGAGSGAEMLGALSNGNSVLAFENDPLQFSAVVYRIKQALYHDGFPRGRSVC